MDEIMVTRDSESHKRRMGYGESQEVINCKKDEKNPTGTPAAESREK